MAASEPAARATISAATAKAFQRSVGFVRVEMASAIPTVVRRGCGTVGDDGDGMV